jgi:hypothetical protein
MKLALTIAVATIAVSSFPLTAQQAGTATSQATAAGAGGTRVSESAKVDANVAVQLQPVSGELEGKLDAKTAKVGDNVVVKTKTSIKTADGTEIPKGAKLIGKVTKVQALGRPSPSANI